jgi:hypothetical protein
MHHHLITLSLADDILADLDIHESRREEHISAVEGWHPDLGHIVVIRTQIDALLVSDRDLDKPQPRTAKLQ